MNTDKIRILIADDEQAIRDEFRKVLTSQAKNNSGFAKLDSELFGGPAKPADNAEYELTICSQGTEAVDAVKAALHDQKPFAAAFLDVRMPPGPDGVWTAEQIRKLDPNVNILIVTAFSDIDPMDIQKRVQPADKLLYVQKPFYPQEIRQFAATLAAKWIAERSLVRRNFELEKANHELDKAYKDLSQADKLKTDFIIAISYDLRTPLTVFKNVVDNAREGVFGKISEKMSTNLAMADESMDRLVTLINSFVELSQIEVGKVRFEPDLVLVRDLIRSGLDQLAAEAKDKNINFVTDYDANPRVWADQKWVTKAIFNVLDNAVKFSPLNSNVKISVTQDDCNTQIEVSDYGCGIPEKDLERVFDRFVRIHTAQPHDNKGMGLGLTAARAIIERHRGTIRASSQLGQGTTISIQIPCSKLNVREKQAQPELATTNAD